MADIRHRVGIDAPIDQVYEALTTTEGLAAWWTRHVEGESVPGGRVAFYFGGPDAAAVMEVTELTPPTRVRWRCVEGPAEWLDTTIDFELAQHGDETVVLFTHGGWREPVEFMHHCSTRWAYFLIGLRAGLGGGKATPWPDDDKISSWA
jgi:uncharacterized protein YndB with AHSA1/START domain